MFHLSKTCFTVFENDSPLNHRVTQVYHWLHSLWRTIQYFTEVLHKVSEPWRIFQATAILSPSSIGCSCCHVGCNGMYDHLITTLIALCSRRYWDAFTKVLTGVSCSIAVPVLVVSNWRNALSQIATLCFSVIVIGCRGLLVRLRWPPSRVVFRYVGRTTFV